MRNQGVQGRLLEKHPCPFYVPCGEHTLNRVVADTAKVSAVPSASLAIYRILYLGQSCGPCDSMVGWWENRVNSIEAVWYQGPNMREAMLEVRDKAANALTLTKVEGQALAEEVGSYRLNIAQWYGMISSTK